MVEESEPDRPLTWEPFTLAAGIFVRCSLVTKASPDLYVSTPEFHDLSDSGMRR